MTSLVSIAQSFFIGVQEHIEENEMECHTCKKCESNTILFSTISNNLCYLPHPLILLATGAPTARCFSLTCGKVHLSCLGLDALPADDLYCNDGCRERALLPGQYLYCDCKTQTGQEMFMVECEMQGKSAICVINVAM
jgi:hypothetical protein